MMMTGYAVDDIVDQAIKEGALASFRKPLDFGELFSRIEEIGQASKD
jgi:DNA-binding NtrC family response regulator